jgi:hypothetical protein
MVEQTLTPTYAQKDSYMELLSRHRGGCSNGLILNKLRNGCCMQNQPQRCFLNLICPGPMAQPIILQLKDASLRAVRNVTGLNWYRERSRISVITTRLLESL